MDTLKFEELVKLYHDKFNISEDLVYLMTDIETLYYCAIGFSNQHISILEDVSLEYVNETIQKYYNFTGWKFDLPINPYKIYLEFGHYYDEVVPEDFFSELETLLGKDYFPWEIYTVCHMYKKLDESLEKDWV